MKPTPLFPVAILTAALFAAAPPPSSAPATRPHPTTAPALAPSPVAAAFIKRYLAADWATLAADINKQNNELGNLPKDQTADITYIKQALAECRPAWWNQVKDNKKCVIRPNLWGRVLSLTFDPTLPDGQLNRTAFGNTFSYSLYWQPADMDSPAPAEHGFTKGDLMDMGVWQMLEKASVISGVSQDKLVEWNNQKSFAFYLFFRGTVASGYYGTPRTRRWTCFLSLDAFADHYAKAENFIPRKPFGAMIMAEIVGHPWKYPSLRIPNNAAGNTEQKLAANLLPQFERTTLTLPEDRALRDAIKEFGMANMGPVILTGKTTFSNKLTMDLDPEKDADEAAKRSAWLIEQMAHPPTK